MECGDDEETSSQQKTCTLGYLVNWTVLIAGLRRWVFIVIASSAGELARSARRNSSSAASNVTQSIAFRMMRTVRKLG